MRGRSWCKHRPERAMLRTSMPIHTALRRRGLGRLYLGLPNLMCGRSRCYPRPEGAMLRTSRPIPTALRRGGLGRLCLGLPNMMCGLSRCNHRPDGGHAQDFKAHAHSAAARRPRAAAPRASNYVARRRRGRRCTSTSAHGHSNMPTVRALRAMDMALAQADLRVQLRAGPLAEASNWY